MTSRAYGVWHFISEHISNETNQFFICQRADPVVGGDTHSSYIIKDATHRYFVKTRPYDDTQQLSHEAEGLKAISNTHTIAVPHVVCHGITQCETIYTEYLVLSHIRFVKPSSESYYLLGQQLAELHRVNAYTNYGWPYDNYIGASVQTNGRMASWADFFAEKRIGNMLEKLAATETWTRKDGNIDEIVDMCRNLLSLHQPHPSLLHGDLWAGNAGFCKKGPIVFDPAVYVGDSETDLAMAELFGGFPHHFFQGYHDRLAIKKNYAQRKPIYQLYPLLNHGLLFGAHYILQAKQLISDIKRHI